jgi:prevent-host-death family protein
MKYSDQIKPISYLKANTAEILRHIAESGEPLVITQNGVAKAVVQDIATYEQTQETMALLKILALATARFRRARSYLPRLLLSDCENLRRAIDALRSISDRGRKRDLEDIYAYVAEHAAAEKARPFSAILSI